VKVVAIGGLVAVIAIVVWYARRGDATTSSSPSLEAQHGATAPTPAQVAKPVAHVTQLSPDERQRVADRIATAQRDRAVHAGPRPELPPESGMDAETFKHTLQAAMREAHDFIKGCYEKALPSLPDPHIKVTAHLTLTGDPDVGTLIDANQLVDTTGKPLPKDFDDCLRNTFQTLELPPIGNGQVFRVNYPFEFDMAPRADR
jgi:hypothetical protein